MSDFKAKMHQIVCRLMLCPRPRCGSLQRSLRPPSWILGGLLFRGERPEGKGEEGREGKVGGTWKRKDGEGRGRVAPKLNLGPITIFLAPALLLSSRMHTVITIQMLSSSREINSNQSGCRWV